jgi:hypothetical protein
MGQGIGRCISVACCMGPMENSEDNLYGEEITTERGENRRLQYLGPLDETQRSLGTVKIIKNKIK